MAKLKRKIIDYWHGNRDIVIRAEELIEAFNDESDRCQKTREWYVHRIMKYVEFVRDENLQLKSSEPATVRRFLSSLKKNDYSWSTRSGSHIALKSFFRWLVQRDYIEKNPFDIEAIKFPKKPRKIKEVVSLVSVQAVIDAMREDDSAMARRDLALLLIMLDGGLRRMEAANLDIKNVDLESGRVAVLIAKGGNQRWSMVEHPTKKAIRSWLSVHPNPNRDEPLFITFKRGYHRLSERRVNGILTRWSEVAKLSKPIRPHDMRRLFATHFSQSGGGSRILQEIMGHENLETTEGYIINNEHEIKRQHRQFSPINALKLD